MDKTRVGWTACWTPPITLRAVLFVGLLQEALPSGRGSSVNTHISCPGMYVCCRMPVYVYTYHFFFSSLHVRILSCIYTLSMYCFCVGLGGACHFQLQRKLLLLQYGSLRICCFTSWWTVFERLYISLKSKLVVRCCMHPPDWLCLRLNPYLPLIDQTDIINCFEVVCLNLK